MMKIVFMGTPDFAVPSLSALIDSPHEVGLVVSQPDAARDRGKKLKATPVKERALQSGIEVLQPEKVRGNADFMQRLTDYGPDLIAVAAYGRLLPAEVLELPGYGCINVHASLLPRNRGAAPIQKAVMDGDEKTGVTIMEIGEGLDTGDMLAKWETPIGSKTSGELHEELAAAGGKLLVKTIDALEKDGIKAVRQDEGLATYAPMISKKDGKIDFSRTPAEIDRLVRAMDPWPGAYAQYGNAAMKIWKVSVSEGDCEKPPGTIVGVSDGGIEVSAGGGRLNIEIMQMPGKKRMPVKDYLRGNKIEINAVLR